MINPTIKKLEDKHAEHKKTIEHNEGAKFHDLVAAKEKEDPGHYDKKYQGALAIGRHNTEKFMDAVLDHNHPNHAATLSAYADKYENKRENVEKDMNKKAVDMTGAIRNAKQNSAYENKVLSMCTVGNAQDTAFMNKFRDFMRTKWAAVGYAGDLDFIKDFWSVHPMSQPQKFDIEKLAPYHYHSGKHSTNVDN